MILPLPRPPFPLPRVNLYFILAPNLRFSVSPLLPYLYKAFLWWLSMLYLGRMERGKLRKAMRIDNIYFDLQWTFWWFISRKISVKLNRKGGKTRQRRTREIITFLLFSNLWKPSCEIFGIRDNEKLKICKGRYMLVHYYNT